MVRECFSDGVPVRHHHVFADYMPAMAAALQRIVGRPDDLVVFLSDFVDARLAGRDGMFPHDLSKAACEMRISRLLLEPVEVNGVVFSLRSLPKRRLRQKSKQLAARVGRLEDVAPAPMAPAPAASPAQPGATRSAAPVDLEALKAAVIEDVMCRLEMIYGRTPASGDQAGASSAPSEDVLVALRQRIGLGEINLVNLADAVRRVCPDLVYKAHATVPDRD